MKRFSTFGLLLKKMFRDFKNGWKQFLAIIFISTLSITLFVGLSSNAQNLENRVNKLYKGGNMADIWTYVSYQSNTDADKISEIVGDKGEIEKRFSFDVKLSGVDATAMLYNDYPTINKPYKTDNTAATNFFVIDENFVLSSVTKETLNVGDNAVVSIDLTSFINSLDLDEEAYEYLDSISKGDTPEEKRANNIFRKGRLDFDFTVTGKMIHPENIQNSSFSNALFLLDYDYFLESFKEMVLNSFDVSRDIIEEIFERLELDDNFVIYNQYCIKVHNKKYVPSIKKQIEDYFAEKGEDTNLLYIATKDTLPSNAVIQNDILQAKQLTYIFPMVFFIVAILVTLTTLSQIILKERTQIGTLKAIGISKNKIFLHYLGLAFFVALLGIILGAIIGPLLIPNIMGIKYSILYTLPAMEYTFPILEFLSISGAFLLATFLVTLLVTHKEIKLNPVESMRPASPKSFKSIKNNNKPAKNFSIKMAFRNIRFDLVKSFMVILGVLGCTALLVCGFGIDDTLDRGVNVDISSFYNSDLSVSYKSGSTTQIETIKETPYKDSTIEAYIESIEEYTKLPATIAKGEKMADYTVIGVNANSNFLKFKVDEDKVSISSKVARELNIHVNDEITFTVLGSQYSGVVGHIFDTFTIHSVIFNQELSQYSSMVTNKTSAWINVVDKNEENDLKEVIMGIGSVNNVVTKEENRDRINDIMSSISYMTMAVKIFAILLAIIVLYNLVLLNYRERTRDIATLKVLGFSKLEIAKSLIFEVMFLTTIGIAFGLLLGHPMEFLVLVVNETPLVDFLYITYPFSYILGFMITFGTAAITNLLLSNLTGRIKMVESLKSVE